MRIPRDLNGAASAGVLVRDLRWRRYPLGVLLATCVAFHGVSCVNLDRTVGLDVPEVIVQREAIQLIDRRMRMEILGRPWRPPYATTITEAEIHTIGQMGSRDASITGGAYAARDRLYVVFDGLSSSRRARDVAASLDAELVETFAPGVMAHGGYYRTFATWWFREGERQVAAWIESRPWSRVVIAGYSLGGVRAILCAAFLAASGVSGLHVVSLNAPRAGKAVFARWYDGLRVPTVTLTNGSDPVSKFPLGPGWTNPGVTQHLGTRRGLFPKLDDHYLETFYQVVDPGFVFGGPETIDY